MSNRARLTSRDFKHGGRNASAPATRLRDMGIGLAIGLTVALGVYVSDHRARGGEEAVAETEPRPQASDKVAASDAGEEADVDPAMEYTFFDRLPKFEVVVPERDTGGSAPGARATRPGVYALQAGSYRNQSDAERVRAQLGKQDIEARVQRVQVDANVYHRVLVGPFSDLAQLEAARENLRRADVDTFVVRVGD